MPYTVPGRAPLALAPTQQQQGAQRMENFLVTVGRLGGFSVASLLQAGMGGLLTGCFLLLLATHQRD